MAAPTMSAYLVPRSVLNQSLSNLTAQGTLGSRGVGGGGDLNSAFLISTEEVAMLSRFEYQGTKCFFSFNWYNTPMK